MFLFWKVPREKVSAFKSYEFFRDYYQRTGKHNIKANPDFEFSTGDALIFFDEIQDFLYFETGLKAFKLDGRYDVICSGPLMGINYNEIESNRVGFKEGYQEVEPIWLIGC